MYNIIDKLKSNQHQCSTSKNYHGIWKNFNKFLIRLDRKPKTWEERVAVYVGYLTTKGMQSATIKSYISAIKSTLIADNYEWSDKDAKLVSLTKVCQLSNDHVKTRLPIRNNLLEVILTQTEKKFSKQLYLEIMWKCLFSMGYYGLFRVGELTTGYHTIKAKDVYVSRERQKMKIYLYSSKTHGKNRKPQVVKIEGNMNLSLERNALNRKYDPYTLASNFLVLRGDYSNSQEPLFVFSDGTPVKPSHMRRTLREILLSLNLNPKLYDTHSFRIGRATDLQKYGYDIEKIKILGRWRSNAVYKYLNNL